MKTKRFNPSDFPMDFLKDFRDIEIDELRQCVCDITEYVYDEYTDEEVKAMFSTFTSTCQVVYEQNLYRSDVEASLAELTQALLFCASQMESYTVASPCCKAFKAKG